MYILREQQRIFGKTQCTCGTKQFCGSYSPTAAAAGRGGVWCSSPRHCGWSSVSLKEPHGAATESCREWHLFSTEDDGWWFQSRGAISGLGGLFLPLCPALYSILSFLLLLFLEQLHLCAVKVGEKKSNFTQLVSFVYQWNPLSLHVAFFNSCL